MREYHVTSAIAIAQVGKSPNIAEANETAGYGQQKVQLLAPCLTCRNGLRALLDDVG